MTVGLDGRWGRMAPEFVEGRRLALEAYLAGVAAGFGDSPALETFLRDGKTALTAKVRLQEGRRHFAVYSFVHTRHSQKAGPLPVARQKMDLPFHNLLALKENVPALFVLRNTHSNAHSHAHVPVHMQIYGCTDTHAQADLCGRACMCTRTSQHAYTRARMHEHTAATPGAIHTRPTHTTWTRFPRSHRPLLLLSTVVCSPPLLRSCTRHGRC